MHHLRRRTGGSARTRKLWCAVACCILATAALAIAGLTADAASAAQHPQHPPSPLQPTAQPASPPSSPLPPPLPTFFGGQWAGDRVIVSASACGHNNRNKYDAAAVAQDARKGHELDWWLSCDSEKRLSSSDFGVFHRQNGSFTPVLSGMPGGAQPILAIDQEGSTMLLVMQDDQVNASVFTMDVDVGAASLKRVLSGSSDFTPQQAVQFGGEVLVMQGTADSGSLVSIWLDALDAPRVLLTNASVLTLLPMQRVGSFVTLVVGNAQIYTYTLGVGRNTQPQLVFNQSSTFCSGGVQRAFSAGPQERVFALCKKTDGPSQVATWSPATANYTSLPLFGCVFGGSAFDGRASVLIECQQSFLAHGVYLYSKGNFNVLSTAPMAYQGFMTFDKADGYSVVFFGASQEADASYSLDVRSVSGSDLLNFGSPCDNPCGVAADELTGVQYISCCSTGGNEDSFVSVLDGVSVGSTIVLPDSVSQAHIAASVVPQNIQPAGIQLLLLVWPSGSETSSAIVSVGGSNSSPLTRVVAQFPQHRYETMDWSATAQALFTSVSIAWFQAVDRIDLATGKSVRLVSSPGGAANMFGFNGAWFYFWLGDGILRIPADSRAAVQPTEVMPLVNCSVLPSVQFDEGANTLWVACSERMLVWNLTSGALSTSAHVFAYPWTSSGYGVDWFHRDPSSGLILYQPSRQGVSMLLLVDLTGAYYRVSGCFGSASVAFDAKTNIVYMICVASGSLVAFSNAFGCTSGSEWDGDSCQPCSSGGAYTAVPFDSQQRHVAQCQQCAGGWIAPGVGNAQCTPCPPGFIMDAQSAYLACSPCQPGYSQNASGTTACNQCSPGSFSSDIKATNCTIAPPGTFVQGNHSSAFTLCSRGSASDAYGLTEPCTPCKTGFESPQFGGTECTACKLGSSAATGGFCSPCPVATYTPSAGSACVLCTDADQTGLACNGFASVKKGWWAYADFDAQQNASVFRTTPCPFGFCPGSALQQTAVNPHAPQLCTPPRLSSAENWLCAQCESGYIPWGDHCDSCTAPNAPLIFAALVACFAIVTYIFAGASNAGQISVLLYFVQIAALELPPALDWLRWLKFSNLGASSVHSCLAPLTPLEQFALTFATPLILCVVLAVIAAVHAALRRFVERLTSSFSRGRYFSALLGIFLFSYTAVALAVMESLHCVSVAPGVRRLYAAPTVDCDSDEYHRFLPLVIIVLCVFVIGMPGVMLLALWRRRKEEQRWARTKAEAASPLAAGAEPDVTPSVLHLGYTDSAWFWAPLILMRRFLFAVIAVLLVRDPVTRNVLYILLHVAFLLLHISAAPFESEDLNRVERVTYVLLFVLSCFLAPLNPPYSVALQLLLLLLVVPPSLGLLFWTLHRKLPNLRKWLSACVGSVSARSPARGGSGASSAPAHSFSLDEQLSASAGVSEHGSPRGAAPSFSHSVSLNSDVGDYSARAGLRQHLLLEDSQ